MKVQYLFFAAMILCRTYTAYADQNTYRINDRVYSCSNYLSRIIDTLCNSNYKIVKRDTSLLLAKLTPKDLQDHMNKQRLLVAERWRRVRRQVASECCDQPCTVGTIIMYCPEDAKLFKENPGIFD